MKQRILFLATALTLGASQMIAAEAETAQNPAEQEAVSQTEQAAAKTDVRDANTSDTNATDANMSKAIEMEENANPSQGGDTTTNAQ